MPGEDGIIRVVEIQTREVTYIRHVVKARRLEDSEVPQGEGHIETITK